MVLPMIHRFLRGFRGNKGEICESVREDMSEPLSRHVRQLGARANILLRYAVTAAAKHCISTISNWILEETGEADVDYGYAMPKWDNMRDAKCKQGQETQAYGACCAVKARVSPSEQPAAAMLVVASHRRFCLSLSLLPN